MPGRFENKTAIREATERNLDSQLAIDVWMLNRHEVARSLIALGRTCIVMNVCVWWKTVTGELIECHSSRLPRVGPLQPFLRLGEFMTGCNKWAAFLDSTDLNSHCQCGCQNFHQVETKWTKILMFLLLSSNFYIFCRSPRYHGEFAFAAQQRLNQERLATACSWISLSASASGNTRQPQISVRSPCVEKRRNCSWSRQLKLWGDFGVGLIRQGGPMMSSNAHSTIRHNRIFKRIRKPKQNFFSQPIMCSVQL